MNPTQLIQVMVCCNEPQNGHFSGYLTGLDLGELRLYCGLTEEGCWMLFEGNYLKVSNDQFYVVDRERWVGNWCWDRITMPAESACRLLNWARKNDFYWEEGPSEFVSIFDGERAIQIEQLALLF